MANRELDIRLVVKDDGTVVIQQAGRKIEAFAKKGKGDIEGMFSAYDSLYAKIATLGGAIVFREALEGMINMGKLGGQVKNVTDAFSRIEGSTALLNKLKAATKGGVTDLELMRNALIGIDLGATNEQMETFARFARFESVRKGRDELEMLQNIMSGVLRGSTELLDNFGISLTDLNARIAQMATESGKSASKLSDVERRQLAVAAATKIMKERLDALGDTPVTDAEKIDQAAVAWDNLKNKISTMASPMVASNFEGLANWLDTISNRIDTLMRRGNSGEMSVLLTTLYSLSKLGKPDFVLEFMPNVSKPKPGEGAFIGPVQTPAPRNPPGGTPPPVTPPGGNKPGGKTTPNWYEADISTSYKEFDIGLGAKYEKPAERKGARKLDEVPILPEVEVLDKKFEVVFSDSEQLALKTTSAIGDAFLSLGSQIGSEFNNLWMDIFGNGKSVFDRLAISLLSSFTSSIAQIAGQFAAASIMNAILPGSGALIGGLFGRAGGGPVTAGQPYMVGERGPEIFIPQQSGRIAPKFSNSDNGILQNGLLKDIVKDFMPEYLFDRAGGGPVTASQPYMVGERGPEIFIPKQSGRIAPSLNFNDTINVEGFLPDEIMQAITKRRNIQRDELIKMLRDIKAVNRMPS